MLLPGFRGAGTHNLCLCICSLPAGVWMGRWRLLEGSMGIPNALPADTSVLKGANVVAYLIGNGKRLGFNTFRCIQTRQSRR